ncbi:MAG: hypothetical protein PHO20_06280, partial [Candidatus Peribacteraceae bacterium]|nr:hypothetical protein [Candidatus Peribacteraceae bacterium]
MLAPATDVPMGRLVITAKPVPLAQTETVKIGTLERPILSVTLRSEKREISEDIEVTQLRFGTEWQERASRNIESLEVYDQKGKLLAVAPGHPKNNTEGGNNAYDIDLYRAKFAPGKLVIPRDSAVTLTVRPRIWANTIATTVPLRVGLSQGAQSDQYYFGTSDEDASETLAHGRTSNMELSEYGRIIIQNGNAAVPPDPSPVTHATTMEIRGIPLTVDGSPIPLPPAKYDYSEKWRTVGTGLYFEHAVPLGRFQFIAPTRGNGAYNGEQWISERGQHFDSVVLQHVNFSITAHNLALLPNAFGIAENGQPVGLCAVVSGDGASANTVADLPINRDYMGCIFGCQSEFSSLPWESTMPCCNERCIPVLYQTITSSDASPVIVNGVTRIRCDIAPGNIFVNGQGTSTQRVTGLQIQRGTSRTFTLWGQVKSPQISSNLPSSLSFSVSEIGDTLWYDGENDIRYISGGIFGNPKHNWGSKVPPVRSTLFVQKETSSSSSSSIASLSDTPPQPDKSYVIDDADPQGTQAFSTSGGQWFLAAGGYQSRQRLNDGFNAAAVAYWFFRGIPAGSYDVYATWAGEAGLSQQTHFKVRETIAGKETVLLPQGSTLITTDQTQEPQGISWNSRPWQKLGAITVQQGTKVKVHIWNTEAGKEFVADAIRLVPTQAQSSSASSLSSSSSSSSSSSVASSSSSAITDNPLPILQISKVRTVPGAGIPVARGDQIRYLVTVKNTGNGTANGVQVIDPIPSY